MSPAQQRGLALWAALLSTVVCLGFLSVTRLVSVLVLLSVLGLIMACWSAAICRWPGRINHRYSSSRRDAGSAWRIIRTWSR